MLLFVARALFCLPLASATLLCWPYFAVEFVSHLGCAMLSALERRLTIETRGNTHLRFTAEQHVRHTPDEPFYVVPTVVSCRYRAGARQCHTHRAGASLAAECGACTVTTRGGVRLRMMGHWGEEEGRSRGATRTCSSMRHLGRVWDRLGKAVEVGAAGLEGRRRRASTTCSRLLIRAGRSRA